MSKFPLGVSAQRLVYYKVTILREKHTHNKLFFLEKRAPMHDHLKLIKMINDANKFI